jgi:ubiquitin C-terminal hydrolase
LPNILILHLKRFQFRDGFLEKIENKMNFPLKTLNLRQWTYDDVQKSPNKGKEIYDLYAVANHMGNG